MAHNLVACPLVLAASDLQPPRFKYLLTWRYRRVKRDVGNSALCLKVWGNTYSRPMVRGATARTGGCCSCSRVENGRESGVHTFTEIFGLQGKLRRSCTWCANCRLASLTLPLEIWTVFPVSSLYWYCGSGDGREMAGDGTVGEGQGGKGGKGGRERERESQNRTQKRCALPEADVEPR